MLPRLPWPLPALLVWWLAWLALIALRRADWALVPAMGAAAAVGVAFSLLGDTWWRRLIIGLGFPVSALLVGGAQLPAWGWLALLLLLLLIYPLNAWRDAPLFPTPPDALNELPTAAPLPPGARILDAGCGLGHGLDALSQAYPLAQLHGIESSRLLRWRCARRCPRARVTQGDFWRADWSDYDLVYLFQRPESMPRAVAKARAELKPGAWLVSLDFEAPGLSALVRIETVSGKPVWVYQAPFTPPTEPGP